MILAGNEVFIETKFNNEREIEDVVNKNAEYLFGSSLILLPKSKISTNGNIETIPDGFVLDFSSRRWFIVEAELSTHDVFSHIAKQITKQLTASLQEKTKERMISLFFDSVQKDNGIKEKLENEGIQQIQIYKIINEIIKKDPIIAIPIDRVTSDLKDFARTLHYTVRLWEINKYVSINDKTKILYRFPEEYAPSFDSAIKTESDVYVDIKMLIDSKLISAEEHLFLDYKPLNGIKTKYEAVVKSDGSIDFEGEIFNSPSWAARACIKKSGSDRNTVNGWTSWKNKNGQRLSEIRDAYLKSKGDILQK